MDTNHIPRGMSAERRWRALAWRDRLALLRGRRTPRTHAEARTAVGHARVLRRRSARYSAVSGVSAFVVWLTLSLVFGAPVSGGGSAIVGIGQAAVVGIVVFLTSLVVARRQSRRLERHAGAALDHDRSTTTDT